MLKSSKRFSWLMFMLLQVLIGTCAGLLLISIIQINSIPDGTTVGTVLIGDMDHNSAKTQLKDYYDFYVKKARLDIQVGDQKISIPYSDIDVSFDVDKTLENILNESRNAVSSLILGEQTARDFKPVIAYNSGKLQKSLESNFDIYNKEPVDESYDIADGVVIYKPQENGVKVNYTVLEEKISNHIQSAMDIPLQLSFGDTSIFVPVSSRSVSAEPFNIIVSSSRIPFNYADNKGAIGAVEGMKGKVFHNGEHIVLSELMDLKLFKNETEKDMVNRIATGIYQAFLPVEGIKESSRRPSKATVPYSEPGLEAVIEGENGDLKLINETGEDLMLLGEIRENNVSFYVVSTKEIPNGILIVQKKDIVPPPVIVTINSALKKNESRVVSEGMEGYTAYVSRVIGNDRTELHSDRYEPVSKVVETGGAPLKTGSK